MGPRTHTEDGIERTFAVNYLGHFYLTLLLIERLKKCAPSRVINVASESYRRAHLDLNDPSNMYKKYHIYDTYSHSKLALMVFNVEFHRHFFSHSVFSFAVHPGIYITNVTGILVLIRYKRC